MRVLPLLFCLCACALGCSRPTLGPDAPDIDAGGVSTRAERAACGDRAGCSATAVAGAGKDERGEELVVVLVAEAQRHQTWLFAVPPGRDARRVRLLAECSECGPAVEVAGPHQVQYVEATKNSTVTYRLSLEPPSILGVFERWTAVPVLDGVRTAAFDEGGWRTTGLGDCAALVGEERDHTARVLATGNALYVEVKDDAFAETNIFDMYFCGGDGKPTSCQSWDLTMDGWLAVTGPPRQLATGEWSESKQRRRAEVSIVSPAARRFRLKLPSFGWNTVGSSYRAAGSSPGTFESFLGFEPDGASLVRCVADAGALRRVRGSSEALVP